MPLTVGMSFQKFLENISLTGDNLSTANTRKDAIVGLLGKNFSIVEAFASGSVPRGTGQKGKADVDVFVVLHFGNHIQGKTPARVLADVRQHLSEYRTTMAKKNGQAVTLYFETWPNVDIVPASIITVNGVADHYEIPDMKRGLWIKTNPKIHDSRMNSLSIFDLSRIVMIKEWNNAHSNFMESYHLETVALFAPAATGNWSWDILTYFEELLSRLNLPLFHPAYTYSQVDSYLTSNDRTELQDRVTRARDLTRTAWYAVEHEKNHPKAIRIYQTVFGGRFPAFG